MYSPPEVIAICRELSNPRSRWSLPGMRDIYRSYVFHYAAGSKSGAKYGDQFRFPVVFDDKLLICFRARPEGLELYCENRLMYVHFNGISSVHLICAYSVGCTLNIKVKPDTEELHQVYEVPIGYIRDRLNSGHSYIDVRLKENNVPITDCYPVSRDHAFWCRGNAIYCPDDSKTHHIVPAGLFMYADYRYSYTLTLDGHWSRLRNSTTEYLVGPNTWMQ